MNNKSVAQERLDLLRQITVAIGKNEGLDGIFDVVVRSVEEQMRVDFACICLYDKDSNSLTVKCVGSKSQALAQDLAMPEQARINVDENGLSRCVSGEWVYEADITAAKFPFPQRLERGGLHCFVAAPLQVEGRVFGALIAARVVACGFGSDECEFLKQLSEHVALAAHHARLYGDLQKAYDDLHQTQLAVMQQERLRALGQMASGVAHDINNALSPITLYAETLIRSEVALSARGRGFLETIQRAVDDIAHTVTRLGDFARPNAPGPVKSLVDLNTLIPQVLALTEARWRDMPQQRGVVIHVRTDLLAGLPPLLGVASEIREALTNLIFNAVDAMPGGGQLTLATTVSGGDSPAHVLLEVIDSGIGMDDESKRRCLEPFFTTKGERGSGLGLAMVYGIAQRHGAIVEVDSVLGVGTTIRLDFPAASAEEVASGPTISKEEPRPTAVLRLLLVDDDPLLLASLTDILCAEGHTVTAAPDGEGGQAAFLAALAQNKAFDAVITDLGMPLIDGRMVAAAVKSASPSTPVILLTGWGQNFIDDLPKHVDCVVSKPPKLTHLRAALLRFCGTVKVGRGEAA
jgi:signal transduction histidine kinase/CheY-like chemotaxis protein